jgi:hypothetical protein
MLGVGDAGQATQLFMRRLSDYLRLAPRYPEDAMVGLLVAYAISEGAISYPDAVAMLNREGSALVNMIREDDPLFADTIALLLNMDGDREFISMARITTGGVVS